MAVRAIRLVACTAVLASAAACGHAASGAKAMTLYTCATANVEQAVVKGFEKAHAGTRVNVFRAPTGQLNARVAADVRAGGLKADVIWACDPLTMHGYDAQGLLAPWSPPNAADIPGPYRTPHFAGIDLLYMITVVHAGVDPPTSWDQLASPAFHKAVAIPSPTFAASALGALGYFAAAPGYGIDYYRRLHANGAVQVNSPTDALTGVEQGTYRAGMTLANAAYADQKKGSPVQVIWPAPGAIAIYAPIGITTREGRSPLADQFASFAASPAGQTLMAGQGTYVTLAGIPGPPIPRGAPIAEPDWPALFASYKSVLAGYTAVFGG
jgi:iron(III) transport system substrate-binding protein